MDWDSQGVTLLLYVYDLLPCGPAEPTISRATESLLNFLARWGYKVSRGNLSYVALGSNTLDWFLKNKLGP
jgi:hypothetical protein